MKSFLIILTCLFCFSLSYSQSDPTFLILMNGYSAENAMQERIHLYDGVDGPSSDVTTKVGVTLGFTPNTEQFDLGIIAWFNTIAVTASYIFDPESDWAGRLGVGKQLTDKYSVFATSVIADTNGNLVWDYGVDVGYNLTNNFGVSVGLESSRKLRLGTYLVF